MDNILKPGQKAPVSGQYRVLGQRGGDKGIEITAVKDKPLPPSRIGTVRYVPIDPTKHKTK